MRELTEQEQVRREKVEKIREFCNPYPEKYEITHEIKDAKKVGIMAGASTPQKSIEEVIKYLI